MRSTYCDTLILKCQNCVLITACALRGYWVLEYLSSYPLSLIEIALCGSQIVTNSGRASTLAASDAATPTLRRIERAAIAAATPITYHPRYLDLV